jgi:hypothetical protein
MYIPLLVDIREEPMDDAPPKPPDDLYMGFRTGAPNPPLP